MFASLCGSQKTWLDLGGANLTVDAACAASLAALDAACKELSTGAADMVLCGGADLHNGIYDYLLFSSVHALSRKGRCATFDASADGIALGEGVACVVLKRLADAERDGDRIYAVVKAVAGSSDGRSLGLTAPRVQGQRLALERAYERAGVHPARIGLVEAHGTGTEVGDRTELATLTETFTEAGAAPGSVTLGSVKSQIGHTKCAAGLAGLIKTAYALHTGVLPGTLHLTEPNRAWDRATSPFAFGRTARPWAAAPGERFAGLSGFGFGGSNFHAVLAGYDGAPEPVSGLAAWPAELLLVRGADRDAARAGIERLAALAAVPGARLRDLARTAAEPDPARVQVAIVASGLDDLRAKLEAAREFRAAPGVFVAPAKAGATGKVAFLYPGQGSQRPNMLADLFVAFPRLQRLLRLADGRYAPAMFPPAPEKIATLLETGLVKLVTLAPERAGA
ncbi:beta-ketoacyl synthase N-terminal-like domain-containing protein, partial [Spirillospora sp. NPDC049652]